MFYSFTSLNLNLDNSPLISVFHLSCSLEISCCMLFKPFTNESPNMHFGFPFFLIIGLNHLPCITSLLATLKATKFLDVMKSFYFCTLERQSAIKSPHSKWARSWL